MLNFIATFFVIATKKVTKEKSRQTRSLRAFCLANATLFGSVILSVSEGSPYGAAFDSLDVSLMLNMTFLVGSASLRTLCEIINIKRN